MTLVHRTWLTENIQPINTPNYDDPDYDDVYAWGDDLDDAIDALADDYDEIAGAFSVAATGGTAILPVYHEDKYGNTHRCPLVALSRNGGDEDYVIITAADQDTYQHERIAERLAVSGYETHKTPALVIRITCHA